MGAALKIENDKVSVSEMPATIDRQAIEGLKATFDGLAESSHETYILDFSKTTSIDPVTYQVFIHFKQHARATEKKLHAFGLSAPLVKQIKAAGLDLVFSPIDNLDAFSQAKKSSGASKINVDFVNPFIEATLEVLKIQANTEVTTLKPYIKDKNENLNVAIAGVISLVSDKFSGSITLCFSKEVFLKIYSNMFGEEHTDISPEIQDAAGELLNIIYGKAKVTLNDKHGYSLQKALPTVLTADRLSIRQTSQSPTIILPFESSAGKFHLEVEADRGH